MEQEKEYNFVGLLFFNIKISGKNDKMNIKIKEKGKKEPFFLEF